MTRPIYGVSTRQSTRVAVTLVTAQEGGEGYQNETTGGYQNETQTLSKRINTPLPPAGAAASVHASVNHADAGGGNHPAST